MCSLKIFTLLLVASCAFADPVPNGECKGKDVVCWRERLRTLFKAFAAGSVTVKNINYPEEALEMNTYFPELQLQLRNADVFDYAKDSDTENGVDLVLVFNYIAEGPVSVQFPKKNKDLKGTIKYEGGIIGSVKYSFENEKVGPETITCTLESGKYTIGNDFIQVLENDPDASAVKRRYDRIHKEHANKVACEIAKATMKLFIENFRTSVSN